MDALVISNLRKEYGKQEAVKGISFSIPQGGFFGFLGPNGAGKTTTIKCIMGLLKFEGSIAVMGHDVVKEHTAVSRLIGFSSQEFDFDLFLSVEQTISYAAGFYGMKGKEVKKRTEELLQQFSLTEHRKKSIRALSGGMKRRLIIARGLVHRPKMLILDEPTAGVDVQLRRDLWEQLSALNKAGTTIILTTHYIEEAERLCDTIGIINKGKIIALDSKEKIMENLGSQTLHITTKEPVARGTLPDADCLVLYEGTKLTIKGKGIKKKAKGILSSLESKGIEVVEVDAKEESLESIFLRIVGEQQ